MNKIISLLTVAAIVLISFTIIQPVKPAIADSPAGLNDSIEIQAEDALITGEAYETGSFTANGGKKVCNINNTSSTVTFDIDSKSAGLHIMTVRAAGNVSDCPNPSHKYWVNGNTSNKKIINYKKATVWDLWSDYRTYVYLENGWNTVTFAFNPDVSGSFSELDSITISDLPEYEQFEAEKAVLTGECVVYDGAAASGGKKVGDINNQDSCVTFSLNVPAAGNYKIGVVSESNKELFSNPSHAYYTNGDATSKSIINYIGATEWDKWNEYFINVNLNEGENTLSFTHSGQDSSFSNIDCIRFYYLTNDGSRTVRYEAENAQISGLCRIVTDRSDSSCKACVGYIDNLESAVTFTVNAPEAGDYHIDLAASSDCINSSLGYYVNGNTDTRWTVDVKRDGWGNWSDYSVTVPFNKGENTFSVSYSGREYAYTELDYILVHPAYFTGTLKLGGEVLDGFTANYHDYQYTLTDDGALPVLSCDEVDGWDVYIVQPTRQNLCGTVTAVKKNDPLNVVTYRVNVVDPCGSQSRLLRAGADPWVTCKDGKYYFINTDCGAFYVSSSENLLRINSNPVLVYTPGENEPGYAVWAPELIYVRGNWYIYYTAAFESKPNDHRMYCIRSKTGDPLGQYEFVGEITPATNAWSIDMTILETNGKLYGLFNSNRRVYIAEMSDPYTMIGERVAISEPTYDFEKFSEINEGPEILRSPDGTIHLIYSANSYIQKQYSLGMATLTKGADPMNIASWKKLPRAVFKYSDKTATYGVGHSSFVPSPDGKEFYHIYHALWADDDTGNREVRIQPFTFNEQGVPEFGAPIAGNDSVILPSGTKRINYTRYEAESAELSGSTGLANVFWASGGTKVYGVTDGSVKFNINVPQEGLYKLSLKAAFYDTERGRIGCTISANGNSFELKTPGRGFENFYYYDFNLVLPAGETSVTISKGDNFIYAPEIDCLDVSLIDADSTPEIPVATEIFCETVVLNTIDGYEYRVNGGQWQTSPVFNGLKNNEKYEFTCRVAEKQGVAAGIESDKLTVVTRLKGDVDYSGDVNSCDALMVLKHSVGKITLDKYRFNAADTDCNESVNAEDALYIMQYTVKIVSSLPVN